MLADDKVADAELAELCVHILDENLGEQDRCVPRRLALCLEPDKMAAIMSKRPSSVSGTWPSRYQAGSRPFATTA
jgi:hypothetical protein